VRNATARSSTTTRFRSSDRRRRPAGNNITKLVQLGVNGSGVNRNIGISASQVFNSDGAGNDTNKFGRNRALPFKSVATSVALRPVANLGSSKTTRDSPRRTSNGNSN